MSEHASPHLLLPYLMPSQAQKHVTHNEALRRLDGLVQLSVIDRDLAEPPTDPAEGDRYIVAAGGSGAWSGWDGDVAIFSGGDWLRLPPAAGWRVWVEDEASMAYFDGTAWTTNGISVTELRSLERLGVGTIADAANPFSAKLNTALWTALTEAEGGSGDLRYTLNKEAESDTLSMLFQSGWSGRAELGLTGSDAFTLKVSDEGATWTEALKVDPATARTSIGDLAASALQVTGRTVLENSGSGWGGTLVLREPGGTVARLMFEYAGQDSFSLEQRGNNQLHFHNITQSYTVALLDPPGPDASGDSVIMTRQKGDARYQQTSSSRRFKEEEQLAKPADLSSLRAKTWIWGGELSESEARRGSPGYGLIAEDVAAVLPEAVIRDADERPAGLDSLALLGAVVEELHAARAAIAALEARLAALEGA